MRYGCLPVFQHVCKETQENEASKLKLKFAEVGEVTVQDSCSMVIKVKSLFVHAFVKKSYRASYRDNV